MDDNGGGNEGVEWWRIRSGIESIARSAAAAMEVDNSNNRYKIDMNSGGNDDDQWRFHR